MCAKAAVRDELWMAKVRDRDLKEQLLLIESCSRSEGSGRFRHLWGVGSAIA
jgi:hypothetical protein